MNGLLRGIISSAITVLIVSCTVKEDRTVCPCLLEVHFTEREHIKDPVGLLGMSGSIVFDETVRTADYPESYRRKVPRSMLFFGAVAGVDNCMKEGCSVVIPVGKECDSLYAFHDHIDCTGEKASSKVEFHKQFATVNIVILNADTALQDCSFLVESASCGLDILTAGAIKGEFKYEPLIEDSRMHFRLPRQGDDSLKLTVIDSSGGKVSFPLGGFLHTVGYDWEATDLQDIYITLDIIRGRVSVGVAGWEIPSEFELTTIEI